jgi:Skp family chaperone for outer membrane proteins
VTPQEVLELEKDLKHLAEVIERVGQENDAALQDSIADLERVTKERDDWAKNCDGIVKERNDIAKELQKLKMERDLLQKRAEIAEAANKQRKKDSAQGDGNARPGK